jgi:hypothetical protein
MAMTIQEKKPRSLAILVLLQVIQGLGLLLYSLYIGRVFGWGFERREVQLLDIAPFELFDIISSGSLFLALGLITLFLAIALWMLKRWAWVASMALQGFSLFAALWGYLRQHPNYVSMVLGILLVFYLNQQEVQAVFRRRIEKA